MRAEYLLFSLEPLLQLFANFRNDSANQSVTHQEGPLAVVHTFALGPVRGEHIDVLQLDRSKAAYASCFILDCVTASVRAFSTLGSDDCAGWFID